MSTTEPIKNKQDLLRFKSYYENINPDSRNALLIAIGLNTALRIGDILVLKWNDVFDFNQEKVRQHIRIFEQKTGKFNIVAINTMLREKLIQFRIENINIQKTDYLFQRKKIKGQPPLRKTFGYHAWKQGVQPVMLMKIFNHSSYQITVRYLCIEQDEKDQVFQNVIL